MTFSTAFLTLSNRLPPCPVPPISTSPPVFLIPHSKRARQFPHDRIRNDPSNLLHRDGRDRFGRRGVQPCGTLEVSDGATEVAVRSLDQGVEGLC